MGVGVGGAASATAGVAGAREVRVLQRSLYSFKLLTECPIIIVLLFQLYRSFNDSHVEPFVPLVFKTLQLQPAAQEAARQADPAMVGMSPAIADRSAYADFIAAQVKVRLPNDLKKATLAAGPDTWGRPVGV